MAAADWETFRRAFRWRDGEHLSLFGPTGSGKTTLALTLLPLRSWVVVFATKPRDRVLAAFAERHRYTIIRRWPPPALRHHVVLWPPFRGTSDLLRQRRAFEDAIRDIYRSGGWTIYLDETYYFSELLRMSDDLRLLWTQGRSLDVTLVAGTQRPKRVPLEMMDQATHLFFFRFRDYADLQRIGELGWVDARAIREEVARLPPHHFLYVNNLSGETQIGIAPPPR